MTKRCTFLYFFLIPGLFFLVSCKGGRIETTGESSIYTKANKGDIETVELAIQQGFEVDQADENGQTLLHHAVLGNQIQLVEILCEKFHANPRIKDNDGNIPMDYSEQDSPLYTVLANY